MIKKLVGTFIIFVLISLSSDVKAASTEVKRLWGNDRYKTCSEIVNEGWQNSDYAVIVNGENFPDTLSASVLAKKYNAPILLTRKDKLDDAAYYQINRLNPQKVFIVGGSGVVNQAIEDKLHAMKIGTERYYGSDRTATSIAVAKQIGTSNGIILTTDSDYTDALSASPIAAKFQMPIILMPKNSIPSSVSDFIKDKNISKTYILGGQDIISDEVAFKFPNVQRINGDNKYERNINIINAFSDKFNFENSCLAYSEDFADALSASAFASLNGNPIILTGDNLLPATKEFIVNKNFSKMYVIGGTAGIKESTLSAMKADYTNEDTQSGQQGNSSNNSSQYISGFDCATAYSLSKYKELKQEGYSFVCRYYCSNNPNKRWKNCLSAQEAKDITNAGLGIVAVYQDGAHEPQYFNYDQGKSDCLTAINLAKAVGQTPGTPIYFAVDYDTAINNDFTGIDAYFNAINDQMNANGNPWKIGVYGSNTVVTHIGEKLGQGTYLWQTYAWSRGEKNPNYNIYQYHNNINVCGINIDKDMGNSSNNYDIGAFTVDGNFDSSAKQQNSTNLNNDTKKEQSSSQSDTKIGTVTSNTLNIRKGAGLQHDILAKAIKGDKLIILSSKANWHNVRLSNGETGWASADYIEVK